MQNQQPPQTPGNVNQINQIRKQIQQEIAELKQQIGLIQQQSLKVLQQTIDQVFHTQVGTIPNQQIPNMQPPVNTVPPPPFTPNTGHDEIPIDIAAMQAAQQSVEAAMQSAQQSVEAAEKALNELQVPA